MKFNEGIFCLLNYSEVSTQLFKITIISIRNSSNNYSFVIVLTYLQGTFISDDLWGI